jgi:Pin2-interacting protein X1
MLERMGWQEGKGLGAREEGDTKHIRISRKKDNSGE